MCSSFKALLRAELNYALVNALLLGHTNSGPGVLPRLTRYCTKAWTGRMAWVILPKHICVPFLNWSPFDCLSVICTSVGEALLSKATSDKSKSVKGSKWSGDDVVNSLTLRSPK